MTYILRETQRADIPSLLDVERSASQLFKSVPQYEWIADTPVITSSETRDRVCFTSGDFYRG